MLHTRRFLHLLDFASNPIVRLFQSFKSITLTKEKLMHHLLGCAALAVATLSFGPMAGAALLASDHFDYSTAETLGSQSTAGGGWSSGWTSNAALTTASTATVASGSLPAPTDYAPVPSANSAIQASMLAYRGLAAIAEMDLGVDQDYYISFLAERTATPSSKSYSLLLQNSSGGNIGIVGTSTGGSPNVTLGGSGNVSQGSNIVGNGSAYLWVIKVSAKASAADQIFVKVYNEAVTVDTTEPVTWNVSSNGELNNSTISQIGFAQGSGATLQIDEVRIGETWEDVVVPEPASVLLVITGLGLLATRRRSNRG